MGAGAQRSVVVTGLGLICPLGSGVRRVQERLVAGEESFVPVSLFGTEQCRCRIAGECALPPAAPADRRRPRAARLALAAAREALEDAGMWDGSRAIPENIPLSVSTTGGGLGFGEAFLRGVLEDRRGGLLASAARYQPAQQVAELRRALGLSGPSMIVANACASGANAIGHAYESILSGRAEAILAGGFEELSELIFVGFDRLQATTTEVCRPFDRRRSGLLLGEGAAFLVLESGEAAARRGAGVHARVAGYGCSTDLHHLTQPSPDGGALVAAVREALEGAGMEPGRIGHVNAHGTATAANDGVEASALVQALGEGTAARIVSTKAAIGHTLGAAGAIEALFAILALEDGRIPPQLHSLEPEPGVEKFLARPGDRLPAGQAVLSVNLGFGGSNAALVFSAS